MSARFILCGLCALYFYDPEQEAVALAHAGWKGTVLEIANVTVEAMASKFGAKPSILRSDRSFHRRLLLRGG